MDYFWLRTVLHYFLHFVFPIVIAYLFFRDNWKKAYFIMLATMLIDTDHLLSTPIFAPDRSSINFHPFHTYWAMGVYVLLLCFKGVPRIIGVGLLFHILTDWIDSLWL
ncbi:DUF6122 family protein [Epilithonimonas pallida]|uniref:LexA-binding, inner membrane-associated hydrolase n=1 Tax=Epilithonimonas pallida TaxID=373671 RepID=A0ABY1R1A1_9FLAO|nr:DUF6122 family protein [Epilithonimonas pallida]SMP89776.1 hypothetical protein SAMN05421679_10295 [Epilithonimonas pallida]